MDDRDLMDMHRRIQGLKQGALALRRLGSEKGLPAVERNATRILAAIKMLEINICDLVED